MANRYDKPVNYAYVSQYVPIPFQELVTLGQHYANERKQAERDLAQYVQKAGEFSSLISKDNESYKEVALNPQIQARIAEAAADPSVMKSAAWRSGLMTDLNSVDYASLSKLKASAESAKAYDAAVKKLALEGKMPPGWEPDYFNTYSTLDSGQVFNATPLPYSTVTDMIKPMVDNIKPGYIGISGGYDIYGVSRARTQEQVDMNMSELLRRQDVQRRLQMYQSMGMTPERALQMFKDEVYTAAAEMAWENRTPNQFALLQAKNAYTAASNRGRSKTGTNPDGTPLTRRQLIDYDLANMTDNWAKGRPEFNQRVVELAELAKRANETKDPALIKAYEDAENRLKIDWQNAVNEDRSNYMKQKFEEVAKFKPTANPKESDSYSRDGYLRGVKSAVKSISGTIGFNSADNKGDILLTSIGGVPQEYTTDRGNKQTVYEFGNSAGFILPEEIFAQGTQSERDIVKRSFILDDEVFPVKQLIEEGELENVQFVPDGSNNIVQMGDRKYISGKLRIPKEDIENELGTHMGSWVPFSGQSTKSSLKEYFKANEVTYGEDNKYYEIDIYRALPQDDKSEYWNRVNLTYENTPSYGGVGGATQAGDMVLPSQESLLTEN